MALQTAELIDCFRRRFPEAGAPAIYRAPGRVNLIGEHTDYSQGFVLPVALDLACYAAREETLGETLEVAADNLGQRRVWHLSEIDSLRPAGEWSDYIAGVAQELAKAGHRPRPGRLLIHSTVPVGAGLSSSAALEVATALALAGEDELDPLELVRLCHRAENNFVGLPCGIMDQYVSVFGRAGEALEIDCRDLSSRAVRLPEGVAVLAVNTMVRHELGGSAYRDRVAECRRAVESVRARYPQVMSLRDCSPDMLAGLDGLPALRARHVVSENQRVHDFGRACARGNREEMGRLLVASHESLRHDYEVSCEELDFLVDTALGLPGVFGARMTGGGFGGCIICLLRPNAVQETKARLAESYQARFGIEPECYECSPAAGACRIC